MKARHVSTLCITAVLVAIEIGFGLDQAIAKERGRTDVEEGVQVLTRGPVHEAFAETVTFNPEAGIEVTKAPPDAIEEVPPEQKPEGDNVAWIPGYWGWDDDRSDFLWVSGIWRALPPGRQWVAGYWGQADQNYQWTSGYWADAKLSEVQYLPEPPETVEAGPNSDAPSADQTWIPGCWVWHQNRYAWQPGYWATVQPNWDWIPAHYVWSPRGYVFNDGYWDYSVARRGVLFAPVYFDAGVYSRQGFSYSPAMAINLAVFGDQLFLRPQYSHYYFGDYYGTDYGNAGFYPWFSFHNQHGYDPFYAHERWQHREDRAWEHHVEADFKHRRDHEDARPPRTLAAQQELGKSGVKSSEKSLVVATSLAQLAKSKESALKFEPVDKQERQKLAQSGQEIQKFRDQRQKLESKTVDASAEKSSKPSGLAKAALPKSSIVAKSADELGKDQAPPKRHEVLKPNLQVEPKPRDTAGNPESPKGEPKVTKGAPRPELRKFEPKKFEPKAEPRRPEPPEPPKVKKPEPRPEPKVNKPESRPEPQKVNKPEPRPEPPKAESKEKPKK